MNYEAIGRSLYETMRALDIMQRSAVITAIYPEYALSVLTDEDLAKFLEWWATEHPE